MKTTQKDSIRDLKKVPWIKLTHKNGGSELRKQLISEKKTTRMEIGPRKLIKLKPKKKKIK